MSRVSLEKFLFRFDKESRLQELLATGSSELFDGFDLNEDERAVILSRDVATMYSWGLHPLLVRNFAGTLGIKYVQEYAAKGLKQ